MDKAQHIAFSKHALKLFQQLSGTRDEHAIADLICDLGHLADSNGVDFLQELERGIGHWHAERNAPMTETTTIKPDVKIKIRSGQHVA
jgi:hypothetical protein